MATASSTRVVSLCESPWRVRMPMEPHNMSPSMLRMRSFSGARKSISVYAKSQVCASGSCNGGIPVSENEKSTTKGVEEGYVGLFVRMLGLDNPVEDREEAIDALWRHSEGGKENVDEILKFPGCLNLVIALISSPDRPNASEAACGLLRQISAHEDYRAPVAAAGAIEEITGLLARRHPPIEVKEQATNVLWNMSVEAKFREKIANPELLPILISMLESEDEPVQTAAAGVISKLSLSEETVPLLLEARVIPKLANILKADIQKVSKVARQEARNALLQLCEDPDAKAAAVEEGLMFVPLVGADAYKSLKAHIHAAPSITEDIKLDHPLGSQESPFGAGDLLLGLNISEGSVDEATRLAMEGRSRLNFLKRVGLLEKEPTRKAGEKKVTILPWWDAIPRIVLILGLEDVTYAKQGAEAVADVAIMEDYRQKLAKAGAVPHLVYLLGSGDESAMEAAAYAIEKLSISQKVRGALNAFDAVPALVAILKTEEAADSLQDKVLGALVRLSQTQEEVKAMVRSGNVAGIVDIVKSEDITYEAKAEAENVLKEISSLKTDPRDKVGDAGGIPPLVKLLSGDSYTLRQKAAAVLENVATKESHALSIAQAGIDSKLKSTFQINLEEGADADSIWVAVCATSRLLRKLLNFGTAREKLDCGSYISLLSVILKDERAPLHVKDWISSCLLKLANSRTTSFTLDLPINKEVIIHDTIPRLVEEMKAGTPAVQEEAVLQLRDLVSSGFPEYVATVANIGGIFPVVDLMGNGRNLEARCAALSIVYSLSMNEENHPAIIAAGAVPFLERLVRGETDGWKIALDLLRILPTTP